MYLGQNGQIVTKKTQAARAQAAGYWHGEGLTGAPSIVVDLGTQEASFYKGGQLAGVSPVSTGREGYRTPAGHFHILQKELHHFSTLYGNYVDESGAIVVRNVGVLEDKRPPGTHFAGAPMPYFMRVTEGVGLHEGFLPGVPDSHGCIRLPKNMAEIFYANAPEGTPVTIKY